MLWDLPPPSYASRRYRNPLPLTAHNTNLTDSSVQLSAKKRPTSKVQIPAGESYLPRDDGRDQLWPRCSRSNLQPPVSPSASASSPCPVFVHSAHKYEGRIYADSARERQLDGLSQQRSNRKCHRICIFCVKTNKQKKKI